MKRYGTVLVFTEGCSKEYVERVLDGLSMTGCLEPAFLHPDTGKETTYRIETYDDSCGSGPVWYVP